MDDVWNPSGRREIAYDVNINNNTNNNNNNSFENDIGNNNKNNEPNFLNLKKNGKPKKSVSWASDDKLLQIREFLKDEEIGHTAVGSFALHRQEEARREKEQVASMHNKRVHKDIQPTIPWRTPPGMYINAIIAVIVVVVVNGVNVVLVKV